jgi:hypothetical protein
VLARSADHAVQGFQGVGASADDSGREAEQSSVYSKPAFTPLAVTDWFSRERGEGPADHAKSPIPSPVAHAKSPLRPLRRHHRRGRVALLSAALTLAALAPAALPASADAAAPRWEVISLATPTNFNPNLAAGANKYLNILTNVGDAPQSGEPLTITDTLPAGVTATAVRFHELKLTKFRNKEFGTVEDPNIQTIETLCTTTASSVTCTWPGAKYPLPLPPEGQLAMSVRVALEPGLQGPLQNSVTVSGGGAAETSTVAENPLAQSPFPFGFSHLDAHALGADGAPYTQAGGHPYELTTTFAFNTIGFSTPSSPAADIRSAERPRDVLADLPPGLIGDPRAVPHCPLSVFLSAQYQFSSCPEESQVGTWSVWSPFGPGDFPDYVGAVFNLTPSHGEVARLGLFTHGITFLLTPSLRSGADYGIHTVTNDISPEEIRLISLTLWGNPADPRHAPYGSDCLQNGGWEGECPDPASPAPFLTMPTSCTAAPLPFGISADSWLNPGVFTSTATTMPPLDGCNQLPFDPTITAKPTTNLADSPSGLDFDLHIPQDFEHPEALATADLRDATVTLPKGLTVNPSSANGLAACSEAQVGYKPGTAAPLEFTPGAAECPDAAKLGTVEVDSPLLGEPENPEIEHPLKGSVYLAQPQHNPFGSLLAIYIAIDDPATGVVVKLAGKVAPDPLTGRLTTTFEENPQLPFEDFHLKFFGGAEGALRTPPTCGGYATTTSLTPWSAPQSGPPATPSDQFQTTGPASGSGPCPTSPAAQENAPRFHAGTETPQAGAFSPVSLKLVREDGSQELKGIDTTLPPGLVGKLAGVAECSGAQLAAAESHSGQAEQASPSCPLNSQVGTVDVASGAGPTPLNVSGKAYLAGPYKGAPLSLAIVTPAVAGPFDLGTVVVRTALYVNPETAQIHAVSDPIPTILQGIPLDVRSVTVKASRPNFTLNPTNCGELSFTGSALSVLGSSASLTQRFQVGGCAALPFKPKLALSLKGGTKRAQNPALKAVLTAKPGEANIARAQVTLPKSEFLDNAHIGTVCTRVQFAEGQALGEKCPAASIYGHAKAVTPLLDNPLEGPVYLRSSSNKLPDLVAALNGQIAVALDGKIDTGKGGGIRNTFELVPDAPVTKFTLEMQGGKKGLLENTGGVCAKPQHAVVDFTGQNGKISDTTPVVANSCPKKHKGGKHHRPNHR